MVAIRDWGTPLVFVNIPYYKKDKQPDKHELYRPIEAAIKAALLFVGIRPLLGREFKALEPRLERLSGFMDRCVGAISDISAEDQLNMPLELGLLVCKLGEARNWVLEGVRWSSQIRCSDLLGLDPYYYQSAKEDMPDRLRVASDIIDWLALWECIRANPLETDDGRNAFKCWVVTVDEAYAGMGKDSLLNESRILDSLLRKAPYPHRWTVPEPTGCVTARKNSKKSKWMFWRN